jgi:hypothetical protein
VTATVLLVTLLLAPPASGGGPAPAAPAACQSFSRASEELPPPVRAWFAHSADERVLACPQTPAAGGEAVAPLYFGEGAVTQHGEVCSYLSHGLTLAGSGNAARLERYDRSEALAMALARADCPRPHGAPAAPAYVETYDVSPSAFVGIMRLWSAATTAITPAEPEHGCCAKSAAGTKAGAGVHMAPEARAHLEAAIDPGRMKAVSVTRLVRIPGSVLRHRYALFIAVPDGSAGNSSPYVVYVDKSLRGPYEITAFAETN